MSTGSMVHIRLDQALKAQAIDALAAMGLSISDAVRMLLIRIVSEKALPFDVRVPNAKTVAAMEEARQITNPRFGSVQELIDDLDQKVQQRQKS